MLTPADKDWSRALAERFGGLFPRPVPATTPQWKSAAREHAERIALMRSRSK